MRFDIIYDRLVEDLESELNELSDIYSPSLKTYVAKLRAKHNKFAKEPDSPEAVHGASTLILGLLSLINLLAEIKPMLRVVDKSYRLDQELQDQAEKMGNEAREFSQKRSREYVKNIDRDFSKPTPNRREEWNRLSTDILDFLEKDEYKDILSKIPEKILK